MKKTASFFLITLVMFTLSCTGKKNTEYRAYPDPASLSLHAGDSSFITINVEIPDSGHIYGNPKGPGTGKATQLRAAPHPLFSFEKARFPRAQKYIYPGEKDFVWIHRGLTEIYLPFQVKRKAGVGIYEIKIELESLLCTESSCIPKNYTFNYPVKVVASNEPATVMDNGKISRFRSSHTQGAAQSGEITGTSAVPNTDNASFKNITFTTRCLEGRDVSGLIKAVLLGLLAGFILNFMPCVLPVVSLKVMSFVRHAGSGRKELFKMGLLFSLGILTSFALLAGLAAFFGYGWGELFQNRTFLVIMAGTVFALGLSMFGVFTLTAPTIVGAAAGDKKNRHLDAYVKGLLATLLATPCSGPFLGGTLAWALLQPPHVIFIIFMSIGLGMALPYLLLTLNPALLKFVPKPGEWLKTFEQAMAFLLIFTAIYLLSILDDSSRMPAVTFLGFVALGFWQFGKYGSIIEPLKKRIISAAVLALIIFCGYLFSFHYLYKEGSSDYEKNPFSAERIFVNRDRGVLSMVKFTADWCPNCRLVEKTALERPSVTGAIINNSIDFMTADITRDNPPAKELMNLLGVRSIPALALIPPGKSFVRPVCLRDIYSEKDVLRAIEMAAEDIKKGKTDNPPLNNIRPLFNIKRE